MNVKSKALAVVAFLILVLSTIYLLYGIRLHNEQLEEIMLAEEQTIDGTVGDLERFAYTVYAARLHRLVESDPALRRAFATRDREELRRLTASQYQSLRADNASFHAWDFNLPDGTVFLRVQDPGDHGDNIRGTRPIIQAVHETRLPAAGYDIGRHGAIYWVAEPVFHDGVYVGATEMGIEARQLMEALRARFGTQAALVVSTAEWQKAVFVEKGYRTFEDHVLIAPEDSTCLQLPDDLIFTSLRDQRVSLGGREFVLHNCAALKNFRGASVGSVLVLQDLTERLAHRRTFIVGAVVSTGLLLAFAFAVLYVSFDTMIGRLERSAAETKAAKNGVERSRDELELRVRERTADLRSANTSLEGQRRFLRTVLESLTHPFYVIDASTYRILLANKAANPAKLPEADLTCHGMTHGRTEPCSGGEHPCALEQVKRTRRPAVLEHVHTGNGKGPRTFEIYAYPVFDDDGEVAQVIEYCVDITDAKEAELTRAGLERQLRQAQKMEAIGTLAGGIAHDFNNILTVIYGHAELIRYDLPADSKALPNVEGVLRAGDRARDLVAQILAFSRQVEQERRPLLVHPVVKEALKLLRATIPSTFEIRESVQTCNPILSDPTQINQIVMNLCTNAFHAMREKGAGILGVSLAPLTIGAEDQRAELRVLAPGPYVKLEVSDTGCGMDGLTIEKIFDPYFTTKRKGEGTGLGLAVVHGIVKSHGGHISVYSQPGVGSTFRVYFPECEPPADRRGLVRPDDLIPAAPDLPRGTERILLVDDEEPIIEVMRPMLESLGYRVEIHLDPTGALRAFTKNPAAFDLMITDMAMPGMSGDQLARKVLKLRPGFPVVLCTGFSEIIDGERAREIGVRQFIMKPILKADLANAVRKALDRS